MKVSTEKSYLASRQEKILQQRCFSTIHILITLELFLVFVALLASIAADFFAKEIVTGVWLDNKPLWLTVALGSILLEMILFGILEVYSNAVGTSLTIALLVLYLLLFIDALPQFWETCDENLCEGVSQDIFYFYFVVLLSLITCQFFICYYQFRVFRLEGSLNKNVSRATNFNVYSLVNQPKTRFDKNLTEKKK